MPLLDGYTPKAWQDAQRAGVATPSGLNPLLTTRASSPSNGGGSGGGARQHQSQPQPAHRRKTASASPSKSPLQPVQGSLLKLDGGYNVKAWQDAWIQGAASPSDLAAPADVLKPPEDAARGRVPSGRPTRRLEVSSWIPRLPGPPVLTAGQVNTAATKARERIILKFLASTFPQLDAIQLGALVGNFLYESHEPTKPGLASLSPNAVERGGTGYGIAQWSDQTRVQALHRRTQSVHPTLRQELSFVRFELSGGRVNGHPLITRGTLTALSRARTIGEATAIVEAGYENPQDVTRVPTKYRSVRQVLSDTGPGKVPVGAGSSRAPAPDRASYWGRLTFAKLAAQSAREILGS
jgi:Phage tail lysozyme